MHKLSLLLALALFGAHIPEASAFTVKRTHEGREVRWHDLSSPVIVSTMPSGDALKDALLERAAGIAVSAWNEAGGPNLIIGGDDPRHIVVKWSGGRWNDDPRRLGVTGVVFDPDTGEITRALVIINDVHFRWAMLDDPDRPTSPPPFDLAGTVTHELGHALGLEHTDVEQATMHRGTLPGDTRKRTIEDDDREGISAAYASATEDAPIVTATERGMGCTTTRGGGADMLALLITGMILRRTRRARRG